MISIAFLILIVLGFYTFKQRSNHLEVREQVRWLTKKVILLENQIKGLPAGEVMASPPEQQVEEIIEDKAPFEPKVMSEVVVEPVAVATNKFKDVETDLSTRWMIWLGGIAFALGGAFLVKYSIDAGLLKPAVRVSLGTILGLIMTVAGEGIRQRRLKIKWLESTPDYLPSAISSAGFFTAFAAIYAAYALYELIPPLLAFATLAALSFASTGLAFYQGRFFAYLGIIGGLFIPALVSTGSGNAWVLFPYLLVIAAASLWVSRKKVWVDVAGVTLLLSMLWAVLWIFTNWKMGDIIPVGLYLLILSGLNMLLLSGASSGRSADLTLKGLIPTHPITWMSDSVALLSVILLVSIVRLEHYSTISFALIALGIFGQAYSVHRSPESDAGGVIAIFGIVFLIGTWHVPYLFEIEDLLSDAQVRTFIWSPIAPPGLQTFINACLSFGGVIGMAIFIRLPWLFRKPLWASVGALLPLSILIIAYWRIKDLDTSLPFAGAAVLIALLFSYGVNYIGKNSKGEVAAPIAAYAAGATMAIALALSMVLRDAWLSFALALEVVALSYIWQKTAVRGLRHLALILATIVLVRLFLNASVFDYHTGPMPVFNWLFYGYGLTAVLFAFAAKAFNENKERDRLITVLRAGWIIIAISFVSLEIRVLFSDGNTLTSVPTNLEKALQTVIWSAASTVLMWREIKDSDILLGKLRRFMTVISLMGLIIAGGLFNNVFFSRVDVGSLVIFNLQFLQFFIPAALYALKAYLAHISNKTRSLKLYGVVAFFTFWFWMSAEVHHAYNPNRGYSIFSDWERYSYSLVWLIYAIALLVLGLHKQSEKIRMAGLGVLSIVVLKVFLIDMSTLDGLSRALSFMGLGAALIGIGYLYQRMKANEEVSAK